MTSYRRMALAPGTAWIEEAGRSFVRGADDRRLLLESTDAAALGVLAGLQGPGLTEDALCQAALAAGGWPTLAPVMRLLDALSAAGLVETTVWTAERPLAASVTVAPEYRYRASESSTRWIASRFAYLHRSGAGLVLESPVAHVSIAFPDERGPTLWAELMQPVEPDRFGSSVPELDPHGCRLLFDLLREGGMLTPVAESGTTLEDERADVAAWEFHDLLFHARTRSGRHREPYGGIASGRAGVEPLPMVPPPAPGQAVDLPRPDPQTATREPEGLTEVLERRRSLRRQGSPALSLNELGHFLHRTVAVKGRWTNGPYEATRRVYPGGGAAYELEVYPAVHDCTGLERGLFHYDAGRHRLERISGPSPEVDLLLDNAAHAARSERPQVLLVFAARFRRVSRKYGSIAYATVLKDVGTLMQTMYLVATAMDLAGCAIGGGNADVFARAAGRDYYAEGSVGEFMLGSRSAEG